MVKKTTRVLVDKNRRSFSPDRDIPISYLESFRPIDISDSTTELFITYDHNPAVKVLYTAPLRGTTVSAAGPPTQVQFIFSDPIRDNLSGNIVFDSLYTITPSSYTFYDGGRALFITVSGQTNWSGLGAHDVEIKSQGFIDSTDIPPENLRTHYIISRLAAPSAGCNDYFSNYFNSSPVKFIRNPVSKGSSQQDIIDNVLKFFNVKPQQVHSIEPNGSDEVFIAYSDEKLRLVSSFPAPGSIFPFEEPPKNLCLTFSDEVNRSITKSGLAYDLIFPSGTWLGLSGTLSDDQFTICSNVSGQLTQIGTYKIFLQVSSGIESVRGAKLANPYIIPFGVDYVSRVRTVNNLEGDVTVTGVGGGSNPTISGESGIRVAEPTANNFIITFNPGSGLIHRPIGPQGGSIQVAPSTGLSFNTGGELVVNFSDVTPSNVSAAASAGSSITASRSDHQHAGVYSVTSPGGTAALGTVTFTGAGTVTVTSAVGNLVTFSGSSAGAAAPADAQYLTLATHADLSAEKVFVPGSGLVANTVGDNYNLSIGGVTGLVLTEDFLVVDFNSAAGVVADVASSASAGTGVTVARSDHAHKGVGAITVTGSSSIYDTVDFSGKGIVTVFHGSNQVVISGSSTDITTPINNLSGTLSAPEYFVRTASSALQNEYVLSFGDGLTGTTVGNTLAVSILDGTGIISTPNQLNLDFNTAAGTIADVGSSASAGSSNQVPRADHQHRGVSSITVTGSSAIYGAADFTGKGNVTAIRSGNTVIYSGDISSVNTLSGYLAGAPYITYDTAGQLTAERLLVAGSGLASSNDGSNFTINIGAGTGIIASADTINLAFNNVAGNIQDVAVSAAAGSSDLVARADHTHRGVIAVTVTGSSSIYGTVDITGKGTVSVFYGSSSVTISGSSVATDIDALSGLLSAPSYLVTAGSDALQNERILVAGSGLVSVDSAPNFTLNIQTTSGVLADANNIYLDFNSLAGTIADVNSTAVAGTANTVARADHAHRGISSLTVTGSPAMYGSVNFTGLGSVYLYNTSSLISVSGDISSVNTLSGYLAGLPYITYSTSAGLTAERLLVAGSGLASDNTDGSNFIINIGGGTGIAVTADRIDINFNNTAGTVADVASAAAAGSSVLSARADHAHRGVTSITATGSSAIYGSIDLSGKGTVTVFYGSNQVVISGASSDGSLSGYLSAPEYVVISASDALQNEYVLTAGSGILRTAAAGLATISASYGTTSQMQATSTSNNAGLSGELARIDHIHQGVGSFIIPGVPETSMYGDVRLSGQFGITLGTGANNTVTLSGAQPGDSVSINIAQVAASSPSDSATPGTSAKFSREDHNHQIKYGETADIQSVGSANAGGSAVHFSLSDHVHRGVSAVVVTGRSIYGSITVTGQSGINVTAVGTTGYFSLSQASITHNNLAGLTTADPHTQYLYLSPASEGRNDINIQDDIAGLRLYASPIQSTNPFEYYNSSPTLRAYITTNGKIFGYGLDASSQSVSNVSTLTCSTLSCTTGTASLAFSAPTILGTTVVSGALVRTDTLSGSTVPVTIKTIATTDPGFFMPTTTVKPTTNTGAGAICLSDRSGIAWWSSYFSGNFMGPDIIEVDMGINSNNITTAQYMLGGPGDISTQWRSMGLPWNCILFGATTFVSAGKVTNTDFIVRRNASNIHSINRTAGDSIPTSQIHNLYSVWSGGWMPQGYFDPTPGGDTGNIPYMTLFFRRMM